MAFELNVFEARVLGCLIEKETTTPDVYPLTLNSLRLACNQKSNRDPVMELDETTVVRAVDGLRDKNLAVMASQAGSRMMKYGHQADRALQLGKPELAILCELLLRGPQTAGELRGHAARMFPFEGIPAVEGFLESLKSRQPEPLAVLLPRQPGRKEPRYSHLLCGQPKIEEAPTGAPAAEKSRMIVQAENERIDRLELELADAKKQIESLRTEMAELKKLIG